MNNAFVVLCFVSAKRRQTLQLTHITECVKYFRPTYH